jgi:GNAT superfamily N-acetyltransferase
VLHLREAKSDDLPFLRAMLLEAAYWRSGGARPSFAEALAEEPRLARYVDGWGRPGDFGIVAVNATDSIGAAWWRCFEAGAPGYGFVDEAVPEISVAVAADRRARGIGTALLKALKHHARDQLVPRLSLSVESDNPAMTLYERLGFRRVSLSGRGWTMLMEIRPESPRNFLTETT